MAKSNFSKVDEYGFERSSDFDYEAYENFMSNYLKVLARRSRKWDKIMQSDNVQYGSNKMKRYIRKGIPIQYRELIWLDVSGAKDQMKKFGSNFYDKLLMKKPYDEELVRIIKTDLPRTFPENIFFNTNEIFQQQLFRILIAYGQCNKNVGYCQGMNYVAGLLLLVTKNENTSFWLLKVLVENILPDYYGPKMSGLIIDIEVMKLLIRKKFSDVDTHVASFGLPWNVIFTKWFICLYCEVMPTETVLRVWDCLFNEGSHILFKVGLVMIKRFQQNILDCENFPDLTICLKDIFVSTFTLNCHSFMEELFKLTDDVTNKYYIKKLRESVTEQQQFGKTK